MKPLRCLIFFIAVFNLTIISGFAQQSMLEIIGTAETNMQPLANAKITLIKDGSPVRTVYTQSNGEFSFELEINSEYLIQIEKSGFLPKSIAFNTELPNDVTGRWTMEFAMSLFPGCEGVDYSALNDPVDRIKYSANISDFISDEGYVRNMRGRIDKLLLDIDKCEADKFRNNMDEGNRLLNEGEYEAAANKFEEALAIYPNDRNAQRKLDEAEKAVGESVQNERRYNVAIAQADRLFNENDLEASKAKYNEALTYNPQNGYARTKIAEIDQMIAARQQAEREKLQTENNYNQLIAQANTAYASKNYEASKGFYEQALLIKPDAPLPRQKISELEPLITKQKQNELQQQANAKAYLEALAMGESAFQANDLEAARQHFNRAQMLKPEESYPRQKIAEIDRILDEQKTANLQAQKAALRQKIEESINEGDALIAQNNYEGAEAAYRRAIQLDPNDAYARQQINKVKSLQETAAAQKQQAREKAFSESVTSGDELLAAASFEQAIAAYKQALLQKPDDLQATAKLAEAERKYAAEQQRLANERDKRKQYDQLLANGNNLFASKQYNEARQAYQSAANLYPDQPYPRGRIQEIDRILAEQQKEKQYNDVIANADGLFAAKNYNAAKSAYQQAITLNPSSTYARQKISEIDALIRENEKLAAEQELRNAQYTRTIQEADNLFKLSRLTEAKASYQKASGLKPNEVYPQQQISKIDEQLAEKTRLENERKAAEQQYTDLISKADALLVAKDYIQAKTLYQQALALKSTEVYPRQKIAGIDEVLREQERLLADEKARAEQYRSVITEADNLMALLKLQEAKAAYQKALTLKPAEVYPQQQITKIDGLLADQAKRENDQRVLEQQYNLAISQADQLYNQNKLDEAKTAYERALGFKSAETYPKSQISKIDAQLAQIEKERQEKAAFEQKYNSVIAAADKAYDQRDYPSAKAAYIEALNLKPSEKYPQERLNKIAEFERILAVQEANRNVTTTTTTANQTTSPRPSKLADLNFANDSERDKYLNGLRKEYPEGVTLEIHKEKTFTTNRYVVIRGAEVREFRMVKFNWGGVEYSLNGIPISGQYFETQIKPREGEFFQKFEF